MNLDSTSMGLDPEPYVCDLANRLRRARFVLSRPRRYPATSNLHKWALGVVIESRFYLHHRFIDLPVFPAKPSRRQYIPDHRHVLQYHKQ